MNIFLSRTLLTPMPGFSRKVKKKLTKGKKVTKVRFSKKV
jgi:hypothetical protein